MAAVLQHTALVCRRAGPRIHKRMRVTAVQCPWSRIERHVVLGECCRFEHGHHEYWCECWQGNALDESLPCLDRVPCDALFRPTDPHASLWHLHGGGFFSGRLLVWVFKVRLLRLLLLRVVVFDISATAAAQTTVDLEVIFLSVATDGRIIITVVVAIEDRKNTWHNCF